MTRDITGSGTSRLQGPETPSDSDIIPALWAFAPLTTLPDDAPKEVRDLTVDIEDPHRVYAIYQASRRHDFQILVEKYIIQLRYGCHNKLCTTPTCFSTRRRLAGSRPVRRYNATSARMLAVHLASQDNPEQGLCQNPSADPLQSSASSATIPSNPKNGSNRREPSTVPLSPRKFKQIDPGIRPLVVRRHSTATTRDSGHSSTQSRCRMNLVDELGTTDHRSFVQNMFGTVAFKMLEFLSPRNLDILTKPEESSSLPQKQETLSQLKEPTKDSAEVLDSPSAACFHERKAKHDVKEPAEETNILYPQRSGHFPKSDHAQKRSLSRSTSQPSKRPGKDERPQSVTQTSHASSLSKQIRGPPTSKTLDSDDAKQALGILNIASSPKGMNGTVDMKTLPRSSILAVARSTSPPRTVIQNNGTIFPIPFSGETISVKSHTSSESSETGATRSPLIKSSVDHGADEISEAARTSFTQQATQNQSRSQSLSRLTIEVINLICDILQNDDTIEQHSLHPLKISLARKKNTARPIQMPDSKHDASLKRRWRCFVEQSLFDILRRPDALLKSFSDDDGRHLDTQILYYLMLRLTRVAPSIVFDSLWTASGNLFRPPERLEGICDSSKTAQGQSLIKPISSTDAARILDLTLHALVAAAPLVSDYHHISAMSRIRSYGRFILDGDSNLLPSNTLCLQYEDIFSNDLAMRLARRIFASVSTRRRYTELLELQRDISTTSVQEPDILYFVLRSLEGIDLQDLVSLQLPFGTAERATHEMRLTILIIDWARNVMLQEWNGSAIVPNDGPFGGALTTITAIHKTRKRLLLGGLHFRTEYFADRLDAVGMPADWLTFEATKRTVHLLDYPWLFNPSTLVSYFRAINYSRMNQAFETSNQMQGLIRRHADRSLVTPAHSYFKLYDRLFTATAGYLVLDIRRTHLLEDTLDSIWRREERELLRPLKLRLGENAGEEGLDSGGVQQEFFRLAIAEALDPNYGVFTVDDRTKMAWFHPLTPEPLWKFELIGMVVSLAVYNGSTLPVTFPKALYRKLLDKKNVDMHHIADGWPDLALGLTALLEWNEEDGLIEDVFTRSYEFSVDGFGCPISREMGVSDSSEPRHSWPSFSELEVLRYPSDSPLVTHANRDAFVSDYIYWLTDKSIRPQFEAFKRGFFACLNRRSISLFNVDTLQSVVEGIQQIDITELRRVTRYVGWDTSNFAVKDFWNIVQTYDDDEKKRLLEFVTASDRIPVGGMQNLQFTLQKNGESDDHLPTSYTCYGILLLPEYSDHTVMREKMAMALENSKGFGFA